MHGQPATSRRRLSSLGLRPKKRLSQSFLEDARVAAAIVRAAQLDERSDVLEVGPGLGVMTRLLAKHARRVVAVEIDAALAEALHAEGITRVEVVNEDILRVDPAKWFDEPFTVVANLPYHITSPVLRQLLASQPRRIVVMVQAEVAARIAAEAGEMSALAVTIQTQADVSLMQRVPAEAFYPRPKVDSAVLVLTPLTEPAIQKRELDAFVTLVQAGFKQPRKTLANSLSEGLHVARDEAVQRLAKANIDPSLRPQALQVNDWVRLYRGA